MVETAGRKILMDALFGGFRGNWCDVPDEETKVKMENAESPYDKTDLVTISHRHSDHFDAGIVMKHLINNPECILICPEQVDSVLSLQQEYEKVRDKIIAVTPEFILDSVFKISDFEIRVLRLEHSHYYEKDEKTGEKINLHQNTENIGIVIRTNGVKFFHCGDSNPMDEKEFKNFNLKKDEINIAFLERLFMYHITAKGIEIIENYIQPEHIVLMHIEPGKSSKYLEIANEVKDKIPNIHIFEKPLDSLTYDIR